MRFENTARLSSSSTSSFVTALLAAAICAIGALGCGGGGGGGQVVLPAIAPAPETPAPATGDGGAPAPASSTGTGASSNVKAAGDAKVGDTAHCPVSGEEFVVTASSPHADYNGKTYYFCCNGCEKKFLANPQKYTSKS